MRKTKLFKSLLVVAALLVGSTGTWAYTLPDGYEIKTVYIGTNNGDGTVASDVFDYQSVPATWVAQDANAAVAIGNVTTVANVSVGSTPESQPTYVDGKTLQLTVSGTNWTQHWARYTLADAVSTGKLIFRADMYQANSPTFIRFLDADGNELLKFGFNNGSGDRYYQYYVNGGSGANCDMHTTYRSYHGFSIEDLVLDMSTGSVSFYLDYINTNSSNQRAQVTNTKNITFGAGKAVKYLEIGSTVNNSQTVHYDNIQFYHVAEAGKNNYEIYARAGETNLQLLASGQKAKDEEYSATGLPLVVKYNNQYYVLDDANVTNYATQTYTMGDADETRYINYTLDETVVYFEEGESLSTSMYAGNYSGGYAAAYRASGDMSHLNKFNSTVISETGVYKADIYVTGGIANGRAFSILKVENEALTTVGSISFYSNKTASTGLYSTPNFLVESGTTLYTGGTSNTLDIDYLIIRKVDLSTETAAFNAMKDYADALVAVANDNASANSTFSTAISTQAAAVASATTAEAITTATSALLAAMNTYVAAANPTAGNQFDLTYLLTNPDLEGITDWGEAAAQGWFTDIPRSGVGQYNNFAVRTNLNSSKNGVERYTSNVYTTAGTYALYQKVTLPAGNYSFDANAFASNASTIVMAAGSTEGDAVTATDFTAYTVDFTVASEAETKMGIKISATGTNACNWMAITEIKLYKEASSVSGTIPSSGYGSLASAYGLDFANATVSSGTLTAYVVTKTTTEAVTLSSVDELPANSGVILKGTAGATYSIPVKADAAYAGTNLLSAAVTATDIEANTAYILQGGEFRLVSAASTVPAGKAYLLKSNVPSGARAMKFVFEEDETTGISSMQNSQSTMHREVYNLNGQRVAQPAKGLYIVDGRKVIVK